MNEPGLFGESIDELGVVEEIITCESLVHEIVPSRGK